MFQHQEHQLFTDLYRDHYKLKTIDGCTGGAPTIEGETMATSETRVTPPLSSYYGGRSAFFDAVSAAYNIHLPLRITPDGAWLCILNGLGHHIDQDPEGLRHHFVQHDGRELVRIEVQAPHMPHVPRKTWMEGIEMFSEELRGKLGKRHDLIVNNFSTTEQTDKLSSEIALMGAMKHYFAYKMMLLCGFSTVIIDGTPEDWEDIQDRVRALTEFDLKWWTDSLSPVIGQFIKACKGQPEIDFWKRGYIREGKGSGPQHSVSGWVNSFFPYIKGGSEPGDEVLHRNAFLEWEKEGKGNDTEDFPSGLVWAPVLVDDHGTRLFNMKFYGGLVGCQISEEDSTVQAVSGWCIQNLGETSREEVDPVYFSDEDEA
jgi:hypothetical protein